MRFAFTALLIHSALIISCAGSDGMEGTGQSSENEVVSQDRFFIMDESLADSVEPLMVKSLVESSLRVHFEYGGVYSPIYLTVTIDGDELSWQYRRLVQSGEYYQVKLLTLEASGSSIPIDNEGVLTVKNSLIEVLDQIPYGIASDGSINARFVFPDSSKEYSFSVSAALSDSEFDALLSHLVRFVELLIRMTHRVAVAQLED